MRVGKDVPMVERSKKKMLLEDYTTHNLVEISRLALCHWPCFFHTTSDGEVGGWIEDEVHPSTLTKLLLAKHSLYAVINHPYCVVCSTNLVTPGQVIKSGCSFYVP